MNSSEKRHRGRKTLGVNFLLLCLIGLLIGAPFLLTKKAAFSGADQEAQATIKKIDHKYHPWFTALWTPPSPEVETFLFALQTALGAGVVGYCLGYFRGKKEGKSKSDARD